jgi:threonine synthase
MSFAVGLKCLGCGGIYPHTEFRYTCPKCGGFLDVQYDYDAIAEAVDTEKLRYRSPLILKRWLEFLPIEKPSLIDTVSLGESETPLIRCDSLGEKLGLQNLFVKNDTNFPTCSLKDRSMPLVILKAIEFGYKTVTIASSGNAAASLAAYAAKAGLKAVVFVEDKAPAAKIAKIAIYEPTLVRVKGTYEDVERLLTEAVERFGWFDCDGLVNPFRCEAKKTYAYEIASQLDWREPDVVVMPVSFGNGIVAAWKGFRELKQMGFIDSLPCLVGVQPEACAPIAKAFREGQQEVRPVVPEKTVADALALGNPKFGGVRTLKAARESEGAVVAVSEDAIIGAMRLLAQKAGFFAEPAGAISIAGVEKLMEEGLIEKDEKVVSVITGHGLNSPDVALKICRPPMAIKPTLKEVERILEKEGEALKAP